MPRFSMKLTASVIGSLALVSAAACQQSPEATPAPEPVSSPSAISPAPSNPSVDTLDQQQHGMPGASEVSPDEAQRVSGTDEEPMGGGGHAGSGGAGGHGHGHGGKTSH